MTSIARVFVIHRTRVGVFLVLGAVAGAAAWFVGMDPLHASAVGIVLIAVGVGWVLLNDDPPEPWADTERDRPDGARLDVRRLSWSLGRRRGRIGAGTVRRLRQLAATRLRPLGLDLDDPGDSAAIERVLGSTGMALLAGDTRRSGMLRAVPGLLDALDRIADEPAGRTGR